jgi:hypothetical protein
MNPPTLVWVRARALSVLSIEFVYSFASGMLKARCKPDVCDQSSKELTAEHRLESYTSHEGDKVNLKKFMSRIS